MQDEVESVTPLCDNPRPRELAREAITNYQERKSTLPPLPVAQVHDADRADLDNPAPALNVDATLRESLGDLIGLK